MSSTVKLPCRNKLVVVHHFGRKSISHAMFLQTDVPVDTVYNCSLIPFKGNYFDVPAICGGAYALLRNLIFDSNGTLLGMSGALCETYGRLLKACHSDAVATRVGLADDVWENKAVAYKQEQPYDAFTCARKFGSRENPKQPVRGRSCWSVNHNRNSSTDEPAALFVHNKPMCHTCYMFNSVHHVQIHSRQQQLTRPVLTADEIYRKLQTTHQPQFNALRTSLKRWHVIACLDSNRRINYADDKGSELHGARMLTDWYEFVYVYKERAAALSIVAHWPLTALGLYWICSGGRQWRHNARLQQIVKLLYTDSVQHSLRNHGMAVLSELNSTVVDNQLSPYCSHTYAVENGIMPWHIFVCVHGTWVLAEYVRVMQALHAGTLLLDIHLVPPVVLLKRNGMAQRGCTPFVNKLTGRARTIFLAEKTTWGYLWQLVAVNIVSCSAKPVKVRLVGSLSKAVADNNPCGGVFQALCELAMSGVDIPGLTIQYSTEFGMLQSHAANPNIDALVAVTRHENALLRNYPRDTSDAMSKLAQVLHASGLGGSGAQRNLPTLSIAAVYTHFKTIAVHVSTAYRFGTHKSICTMLNEAVSTGALVTKDVSKPL